MEPTTNIKDSAEAIKGIIEAVPIYQDLAQPALQELGKGLQTLSKTVHIALAPVSAMVWGYEKISGYLQTILEAKLENVPSENIIAPDISIAGPTIESMRFTGDKEELRDMFANLLASAMNSETADDAHPSFVEIIKQLNIDEAKILKYIKGTDFPTLNVIANHGSSTHTSVMENFSDISFKAGCEKPEKIHSYLENLNRLGLIKLYTTGYFLDDIEYIDIENNSIILDAVQLAASVGEPKIIRSHAHSTMFGTQFYNSCIKS